MSFERFEKAADFLDRAVVAGDRGETNMSTDAPKATLKTRLLEEFDEEMRSTRKMLDRIPEDKFSWRPHEKSSSLGKLANHIATAPGKAAIILKRVETMPPEAANKAELLANFDTNVAACREQLVAMSDDRLAGNMLVTATMERPVWSVLRGIGLMNHLIHHRGQLSVYLRLLEVAVPGMYGPSADEK